MVLVVRVDVGGEVPSLGPHREPDLARAGRDSGEREGAAR